MGGKTCGLGAYKDDGNCDDVNNICGCDWDGGDCCGPSVKTKYCKVCKCLNPDYKAPACGAPAYKGDKNCDDENNNKNCDWDGGDCCGPAVKKTYCKVCKCLDPKAKCKGKCVASAYVGDGNCDDENNNCGCKYDGGDCCAKTVKGGKVKTDYCKDCSCVDPAQKLKCNGKCGAKAYVGDGNCDDNNNNCGCNYDGGDCCPQGKKPVSKKYCTICKCINPK